MPCSCLSSPLAALFHSSHFFLAGPVLSFKCSLILQCIKCIPLPFQCLKGKDKNRKCQASGERNKPSKPSAESHLLSYTCKVWSLLTMPTCCLFSLSSTLPLQLGSDALFLLRFFFFLSLKNLLSLNPYSICDSPTYPANPTRHYWVLEMYY